MNEILKRVDRKKYINEQLELNSQINILDENNYKSDYNKTEIEKNINLNIAKKSALNPQGNNENLDSANNNLPIYNIERIETVSSIFKQIIVYVTIDKKINDKRQELLSEHLSKIYIDYSNIIICLYSNEKLGLKISKGELSNINSKNKRTHWLAMYTYNPVEGSFFDPNPSGYLDIY